MRKPYVFQMRIFALKIFIQTTLSLAEFESNKCLPIFTHVSITCQNYVISKHNNHYVLKVTYVLHKLAIFNAALLPYSLIVNQVRTGKINDAKLLCKVPSLK